MKTSESPNGRVGVTASGFGRGMPVVAGARRRPPSGVRGSSYEKGGGCGQLWSAWQVWLCPCGPCVVQVVVGFDRWASCAGCRP